MANEVNHQRFQCCYHNWVAQQHLDLHEMLQVLPNPPLEDLQLIIQKSFNHFEDYLNKRAALAPCDATSFLSPSWGPTFSNSLLWIGGCRPSMAIRLLYSLSGSDLEAYLDEFLAGDRNGDLGELSAQQLKLIDALHCKILKQEEVLTSQIASLQEELADEPLALMAKRSDQIEELSEGVNQAMDAQALGLSNVLIAADKLRLTTFKDLMHILTPLQGFEFLLASKKLHLAIYEWGKARDRNMGIPHKDGPSVDLVTSTTISS